MKTIVKIPAAVPVLSLEGVVTVVGLLSWLNILTKRLGSAFLGGAGGVDMFCHSAMNENISDMEAAFVKPVCYFSPLKKIKNKIKDQKIKNEFLSKHAGSNS